jgi:hypothetical protein
MNVQVVTDKKVMAVIRSFDQKERNILMKARILHAENQLKLEAANSSDIAASLESGLPADFDTGTIYQQIKLYCHE